MANVSYRNGGKRVVWEADKEKLTIRA